MDQFPSPRSRQELKLDHDVWVRAVKDYVRAGANNDATYNELKERGEQLAYQPVGSVWEWSTVKVHSYMLICDEVWSIEFQGESRRRYPESAAEIAAKPLGFVAASLAVALAFWICAPLIHSAGQLSGGFQAVAIIALGPFLFVAVFGAVVNWAAKKYIIAKDLNGWPAHRRLLDSLTPKTNAKSLLSATSEPDGTYRGRRVAMRFHADCADYFSSSLLGATTDKVWFAVAMSTSTPLRLRVFRTGRCQWLGKDSISVEWKPVPVAPELLLIGMTIESDAPERISEWLQKERGSTIRQIFSDCMIDNLYVFRSEVVAYVEENATLAAERERSQLLLELLAPLAESLEQFCS